ncbi:alpha/beta fold hydrolase [Sedimenticola sp.]|uniref:alpha/beta fold hydrolase n=1 Tax=Sedimenticola sp. TaxID=1940285 RepID=UPI003D127AA3
MHPEQAIDDLGSGTPLVLLHSSMSSKSQWRKLAEQLAGRYRTLAIDLYGYGEAEYPATPEQFTLTQETDRIETIIRQSIGDQPFHLIGHSYGGATALRYAYAHQSNILTLGLYEPVAFHLLEPNEPAYQIIREVAERVAEYLNQGDIAAAAGHFIDFWSSPGTYLGLPAERQRILEHYIPKVSLDFQAILRESVKAADYRTLKLPICMLRSQESPLPTRRVAEVLENTLPRLECHWVPGGHMAPITHAEIVNLHWIRFIQQPHHTVPQAHEPR